MVWKTTLWDYNIFESCFAEMPVKCMICYWFVISDWVFRRLTETGLYGDECSPSPCWHGFPLDSLIFSLCPLMEEQILPIRPQCYWDWIRFTSQDKADTEDEWMEPVQTLSRDAYLHFQWFYRTESIINKTKLHEHTSCMVLHSVPRLAHLLAFTTKHSHKADIHCSRC